MKVLALSIGVGGGALVLGAAAFIALVALTPLHQREEARAELAQLKGASSDPVALATQFSVWVTAVRAARPTQSGAGLAMTFVMDKQAQDMARVEQAAAEQRYRERLDEAELRARVDYHERWRDAVLAVLSASGSAPREAREPHTFKDLAVIEEALALAAQPPVSRGPEAIRQLRAKLDEAISSSRPTSTIRKAATTSPTRCTDGALPHGGFYAATSPSTPGTSTEIILRPARATSPPRSSPRPGRIGAPTYRRG